MQKYRINFPTFVHKILIYLTVLYVYCTCGKKVFFLIWKMGPRYRCVVPFCPASKKQKWFEAYKVFKVPPSKLKVWCEALDLNILEVSRNPNAGVCEKHFDKRDIYMSMFRTYIGKSAIPKHRPNLEECSTGEHLEVQKKQLLDITDSRIAADQLIFNRDITSDHDYARKYPVVHHIEESLQNAVNTDSQKNTSVSTVNNVSTKDHSYKLISNDNHNSSPLLANVFTEKNQTVLRPGAGTVPRIETNLISPNTSEMTIYKVNSPKYLQVLGYSKNVELVKYQPKIITIPPPVSGSGVEQKYKLKIAKKNLEIKNLKRKLIRRDKEVHEKKELIKNYLKTITIDNRIVENFSKDGLEVPKAIFERLFLDSLPPAHPEEVHSFAAKIYSYSPNAYSFVRKTFHDCLPHPGTIKKINKLNNEKNEKKVPNVQIVKNIESIQCAEGGTNETM